MDFIIALPKFEEYGNIMVVVYQFNKYVIFISVSLDCTTRQFWTQLPKLLGMDLNFSSSFHLQSDG